MTGVTFHPLHTTGLRQATRARYVLSAVMISSCLLDRPPLPLPLPAPIGHRLCCAHTRRMWRWRASRPVNLSSSVAPESRWHGRAYTPPLRPPGGVGMRRRWPAGPLLSSARLPSACDDEDDKGPAICRVRTAALSHHSVCLLCREGHGHINILLAVDDDGDFYGRHSLATLWSRLV